MKISRILLPILALTLVACDDNGKNGPITEDIAVVAARAPDYSSGAISLVKVEAPFTPQNSLAGSISDISVRSGGGHYFVIEKSGTNKIKRFETSNPNTSIYSYSTDAAPPDSDSANDSNPYDLIIASPTKAYLLRYGSGKLWIVDPSATSEANFKKGEIDLSAYDPDGIPEMSAGVIKGGRLYVVLQRLDSFSATRNGYVAVIDTANDQEIDTRPGVDGLKGIELPLRNPSSIVASPSGNRLFVIATGGYLGPPSFAPAYDGGIASIDASANTAALHLDDGSSEVHPYGQFGDLVIASADRGYFIGNKGFFGPVDSLYRFNPGSSAAPVAVSGFDNVEIGALAIDPTGRLWVGRNEESAPGVSILDIAASGETPVKNLVGTVLIPINIDFVTVPRTP